MDDDAGFRAVLARANAAGAAGRLAEAEAAYRDALARRPHDLEALNNLAGVLGRLGRGDDAVTAYRAAIQHHPAALEPRLNLAIALTRAGHANAALAEYDALLAARPDHATAHFYRANLLASLDQLDAARVGYDRALALAPDHAEGYCNRGLVAARHGDLAAAERDFMAALRRQPGLVPAWQALAALLRRLGRLGDAAAALARVAALRPDDAEAQLRLAQGLAESGAADAALDGFARAVALGGPPLAEALRGLASLRLARGERAAARRHYARAAVLEPVIRWHDATVPGATRVLALVGPGLANTPVEHLVAASRHAFGMVLALPGVDPDAAALAARGDLVLNLISDADVGTRALRHAGALVDRIGRPVINHPARIARTDRQTIARRLAGLPGCVVPETMRCTRGALARAPVPSAAQPWLVRPAGDHGGERLEKVADPDALAGFVAATEADAFYLTRFVDFRSADGHHRKYRFVFLGDARLPYHLAIGEHWKVHYFRTAMDQHDWMRREEAAFLADPACAFGPAQRAALDAIRAAIDLEFFGLDCAIDRAGALVVFEANASMLIHAADSAALFPYKQASFARIRDAFDRLIATAARHR